MIKITREMVSKMGKEITGKEKGEKCNLSTFNKVKKVMDSIYTVLHEIYDLDTECTDINGVMVSFGSKKRLKLIFRNNKVEITDKSMLDEEFKGFTKYSVEKSDRFIRLMKQKVKNLKIKEFLNNVVPVLFEECKEKDDYVIDYCDDVVVEKEEEEEKPKTIYSINDLRKTKAKFNAVQIFGCKESDFSDILGSLNIPIDSHCVVYKDNITQEFYPGSHFDELADVVTRSATNLNPVYLDIDRYEKPIELNIICDNTDKILFDIKNINNIKSINFFNIRPEYNEDSDLLENEEDYVFLWKDGKFELCKKGTNLRAIHQKPENIINIEDKKQLPVPQVILNEYLTEQAIQTFSRQGLLIANNYDVFRPHYRQFNKGDYDYMPKLYINNFLNLFVTFDDFHVLSDLELDLADYDFNLNENMEGTIESKSGTYKEVIEKIDNCDWGCIDQGCYCITQYIDENNPYYPVLKVYTFDEKHFTRISHIEMYINGELIKQAYYNLGYNPNPFSIHVETFNKLNRGFDRVSSQFLAETVIGRSPILIFKSYEKDGCIYTFNANKDEIYMNDKEKELHLCQNQLLENSNQKRD